VSISKRMLGFMCTTVVLAGVFTHPVTAGDCTPRVDASLKYQNHDMGENFTNLKFRIEVDKDGGKGCSAINYTLVLHVETSAGEEQNVQLRQHVKVDSSSVSMLVEHQLPADDNLARWEVVDSECHACAPGD
jgi:hypothetical protein